MTTTKKKTIKHVSAFMTPREVLEAQRVLSRVLLVCDVCEALVEGRGPIVLARQIVEVCGGSDALRERLGAWGVETLALPDGSVGARLSPDGVRLPALVC